MPTSRTATAQWKRLRTATITLMRDRGQTTCPECGVWLTWDQHGLPTSPEVDHITPHAQGGTDTPDNVRVICRTCNRRLGAKTGHARRVRQAVQPVTPLTTFQW